MPSAKLGDTKSPQVCMVIAHHFYWSSCFIFTLLSSTPCTVARIILLQLQEPWETRSSQIQWFDTCLLRERTWLHTCAVKNSRKLEKQKSIKFWGLTECYLSWLSHLNTQGCLKQTLTFLGLLCLYLCDRCTLTPRMTGRLNKTTC